MNRIACLWIPSLPVQVERRTVKPGTEPLIVCADGEVIGACSQAQAKGVHVGDTLDHALGHCPQAIVVHRKHNTYEELWQSLLDDLERHTPTLEAASWGEAYLDARGVSALYGGEVGWCSQVRHDVWIRFKLRAQMGVAATRFAALVAARAACSGQHIVSQSDRAYLAPQPLDDLPLHTEALRRLRMLGIQTMGGLARLPVRSVSEQLGPESLAAHRWARGVDDRPIAPRRRQVLNTSIEFETPETDREALVAGLVFLSRRAQEVLRDDGLGLRRATVRATLVNDHVITHARWLPQPCGPDTLRLVLTSLGEGLAKGLHQQLDGTEGPAGVGVSSLQLKLLALIPGKPRQLDLFAHTAASLQLEETLRQLTERYAADAVVRPRKVAAYVPGTATLAHRQYLWEPVRT